jgi:hypothetical protein
MFELVVPLYIVSWWELHGSASKELSTMALRILKLTCGILAYEPSWIKTVRTYKIVSYIHPLILQPIIILFA